MKYFLFAIALFCIGPRSLGADGVLKPFLRDMVTLGFGTKMIVEGGQSISQVRFTSSTKTMAQAMYYAAPRILLISADLRDPWQNRIRDIQKLDPVDIGTLVHELWHSYYNMRLRLGDLSLKKQVMSHVHELYRMYPREKRSEIQEEGYGLYIQRVVSEYFDKRRSFQRTNPELLKIVKERQKASYEEIFVQRTFGYYQSEFSFVKHQLIYSTVSISDEDKRFILEELLGGRLSGKLDLDFIDF